MKLFNIYAYNQNTLYFSRNRSQPNDHVSHIFYNYLGEILLGQPLVEKGPGEIIGTILGSLVGFAIGGGPGKGGAVGAWAGGRVGGEIGRLGDEGHLTPRRGFSRIPQRIDSAIDYWNVFQGGDVNYRTVEGDIIGFFNNSVDSAVTPYGKYKESRYARSEYFTGPTSWEMAKGERWVNDMFFKKKYKKTLEMMSQGVISTGGWGGPIHGGPGG